MIGRTAHPVSGIGAEPRFRPRRPPPHHDTGADAAGAVSARFLASAASKFPP